MKKIIMLIIIGMICCCDKQAVKKKENEQPKEQKTLHEEGIQAKINKVISKNDIISQNMQCPDFQIPFIGRKEEKCISIEHYVNIDDQAKIECISFFDENGTYLGSQSRSKENSIQKEPIKEIELEDKGQPIIGQCSDQFPIELNIIWQEVANRIQIKQILEFNMYCVNKTIYHKNKEPINKSVMIVNLYGPEQTFVSSHPDAEIPPKIRLIYDLEQKKIIVADTGL